MSGTVAEAPTWKALLVACGSRRLALRLRDVVEVCRALPIAPLPGVTAPVIGVAILRGVPVPVVDVGMLVEATDSGPPAMFVTIRIGQRVAALAVGEVLGIRDLPDRLDELPPLVADSRAAGIAAVARLDGELVAILRHSRLVPAVTWDLLAGASP